MIIIIIGCFALGVQLVVLGQSLNVSQKFHQRARIIFPMMHRSRLVYVGTSSFTIEVTLLDQEFGDELVKAYRTFAGMRLSDGKSQPLPQDVR